MLLLLFFPSANAAPNYQPIPTLLTVGSMIARFEGSPLATADRFAEISQLDTATGLERVILPLWGANTPAFANQITGLRWSDKQLALTYLNQAGQSSLAIYDTDSEVFATIIDAGMTQISPASWHGESGQMVFSALQTEVEQVFLLDTLTLRPTPLIAGRLPTFASDEEQIAFLNDATITLYNLETQTAQPLPGSYPAATSLAWSPDGNFLAVNEDAKIILIALGLGEESILFDGNLTFFEYPVVSLSAIAWALDGQQIAFTALAQDGAAGISQVLTVEVETGEVTVQAERIFPADGTLPADARIYTEVTYQPPGAFLPGGNAGDF